MDFGNGVNDHLESSLRKFAVRPIEAHVTFTREAQQFDCEITIHLSTGLNAQARARSMETYPAFDQACDKLRKQLRRYKRRLKNHHNERKAPVTFSEALTSVVVSPADNQEENEPETLQPVIIAETETPIPALAVGEAVMQMELAEASLLVFRNLSHGGVNVVHRRDDGHIGWIDPRSTS